MRIFSLISPHRLHLGCCGTDVNVCVAWSQLLWKEKIPPIMTSPSLLSWGGLGVPLKLQGGSAALTRVNRSHVCRKLILALKKTPCPLVGLLYNLSGFSNWLYSGVWNLPAQLHYPPLSILINLHLHLSRVALLCIFICRSIVKLENLYGNYFHY